MGITSRIRQIEDVSVDSSYFEGSIGRQRPCTSTFPMGHQHSPAWIKPQPVHAIDPPTTEHPQRRQCGQVKSWQVSQRPLDCLA